MREYRLRAWHDGNQRYEYATLQDIWDNGFLVAEGRRRSLVQIGGGFVPIQLPDRYPTEEEMDEWRRGSFYYNADWEFYNPTFWQKIIVWLKSIPKRRRIA